MLDKNKLEKEINVLGSEISNVHRLIFALKEIINQSNKNFDVYKRYFEFFYQTYVSYWNDLIHHMSRLQDMSRDSLSIIKILHRHSDYKDELSQEEKNILSKLIEQSIGKKISTIRNKLAKAHLDGKVSINIAKQNKIYEENKFTLDEVSLYLDLLTEALTIISRRLKIPIDVFLKPTPTLKNTIHRLFEDLAKG